MMFVTPLVSGREMAVARFVPRVALVGCMFAGGGGAKVLSVKAIARPTVACGAEDGLTLEMTLVAVAKARDLVPRSQIRTRGLTHFSPFFPRLSVESCAYQTSRGNRLEVQTIGFRPGALPERAGSLRYGYTSGSAPPRPLRIWSTSPPSAPPCPRESTCGCPARLHPTLF